jgi:hypothetical protein
LRRIKKANAPITLLNIDRSGQPSHEEPLPSPESSVAAATAQAPGVPAFETVGKRSSLVGDLFRALLIVLSLVVAAGFILIVLPQLTMDKVERSLQAQYGVAGKEKIAFLYLGDEIINNELHVRGVVRNISTAPIEQLDAVVRFYAADRSLLETTVVRMNKEVIGPDEIAQFELVYPNYSMSFASFSAEFKLRKGALVPFKDMRTAQARTN